MLNALPHPVMMVTPDGKIFDANVAAESFFEASVPVLRRHRLRDLVPFGSPLLALVDQVRERGAAVNEYKRRSHARREIPATVLSTCTWRRWMNALTMWW